MTLSGCGGGFGGIGLHRLGRRAVGLRLGIALLGLLGRHLHRDAVKRQIAPLRLGVRRRRLRIGLGIRRARFGRRLARLLDLELIVEHRLAQRRRRQQAGHLQQHGVRAAEFGFDKAARIGRGIDEIARCAAARAETEAIERDQRGLRIAGHRLSLELSLRLYSRGRSYRRSG